MPINSSNKNIIYPSGTTANRPTSVNNGYIYFNTTIGALQIYQNGSWYVLTNINAPGVPTSVIATDQGTGRGFNNGQASVAFTPATETFGFPATYTITPTPTTSPATFTGISSPIVVTGLASSIQYTYTATATNNTGTSSASSASSGVTATTVPQAPTIGTATGGAASASLTFTAGATGGSAITSYTATSSPGNITATGASSPITITGLTDGTAYTFTVTATNANGTSSASSASNSVIPQSWTPDSGYDALGSVTLSTSTAVINFAGIPSGYKHLQIRGISKATYSNTGTGASQYKIQFNGDTAANYTYHNLYGNGTSALANAGTSQNQMYGNSAWDNTGGLSGYVYIPIIIDILDYQNTNKYKTVKILEGFDVNSTSTNQFVGLRSHLWQSTSAITSITLDSSTPYSDGNFAANTQFSLYGVK